MKIININCSGRKKEKKKQNGTYKQGSQGALYNSVCMCLKASKNKKG